MSIFICICFSILTPHVQAVFDLVRKLLKTILVKRMPKNSHRPVERKLLTSGFSNIWKLVNCFDFGFHVVKRGRQRVKNLS